jgi:hypothetical protein
MPKEKMKEVLDKTQVCIISKTRKVIRLINLNNYFNSYE